MKTLKKCICVLFISAISSPFIEVEFIKENHFNLITANTVLTGFLFTSLSILLGFLNEEIVQLFEEAGALKKVYNAIQNGIIYSLMSILISIVNITICEKYISSKLILNFLYDLEILLLVITLYSLFITIKELKTVIDSIRIDRLKKKKQDLANNELSNLLDQDKNN